MSFSQYYRHYLTLHRNKHCRRLHLLGMAVALGIIGISLLTHHGWMGMASPLAIYPFAWIGHFFFEKNTPATFNNPVRAGLADLRMTWDILTGRLVL